MLKQLTLSILMLLLLAGCRQATKTPSVEPLVKEKKDGDVTVRLIVENPDVTLDDDVVLRVEAECPEGVNVELPDLKHDVFDAFELDASKIMDKKLTAQGTMLFRRVYGLEPLNEGEATVDPFIIKVMENGETREIETPEISLKIKPGEELGEGLAEDELELMAIRSPWQKGWILWSAGGAVALAIASLLIWRQRRREKAVAEERKSPLETALAALEQLEKDDLVAKGELKEYYGRVSSILREYVEGRYGLQAPERTTEEFMEDLRRDSGTLSKDQKSLLEKFLMHCDLVKFAKFEPSADEVRATFESCKDFVVAAGDKPPEDENSKI
ncbi:MAG: hypothetical protein IKX48_17505 [Victivallales bacterium]|nr:hypothetical protein [Victivallales bacterium]